MKSIFKTLVCLNLLGFAFLSEQRVHAEPLDGYVGLSGGLIKHLNADDQYNGQDSRYSFRLDFVRVQKSVALDLRYGTGLGYQDMGGAFKIFHHFSFSNATATGISVGGGIGGMYSQAGIENSDTSFYEIFAPVFARVIFDVGLGVGLFIDTEYSAMFQRRFTDQSQATGQDIAGRFYLGAGLAIVAM